MSDFPDDFGMQTFSSLGKGVTVTGQVTVNAGLTDTVVLIEGKGSIYGGSLVIDTSAETGSSAYNVLVDGDSIFNETLSNLLLYRVGVAYEDVMKLQVYDKLRGLFVATLQRGITYITSFKVEFVNAVASAVAVTYRITYASVE